MLPRPRKNTKKIQKTEEETTPINDKDELTTGDTDWFQELDELLDEENKTTTEPDETKQEKPTLLPLSANPNNKNASSGYMSDEYEEDPLLVNLYFDNKKFFEQSQQLKDKIEKMKSHMNKTRQIQQAINEEFSKNTKQLQEQIKQIPKEVEEKIEELQNDLTQKIEQKENKQVAVDASTSTRSDQTNAHGYKSYTKEEKALIADIFNFYLLLSGRIQLPFSQLFRGVTTDEERSELFDFLAHRHNILSENKSLRYIIEPPLSRLLFPKPLSALNQAIAFILSECNNGLDRKPLFDWVNTNLELREVLLNLTCYFYHISSMKDVQSWIGARSLDQLNKDFFVCRSKIKKPKL